MAGFIKIQSGHEVPISLQINDGAVDQYPQAEVRTAGGVLLTTLDLSHVANGLYKPTASYNMPSTSALFVTYVVYRDSGHTVESDVYLRDLDVFGLIDVDEYKADISNLALESNVEAHVTNALNSYDPPTRSEAIVDKNEIISQIQDFSTTMSGISGEVWDEVLLDHQLPCSIGEALRTTVSGVHAIVVKLPFGNISETGEYITTLNSIESYIVRMLGLMQENYYLDNTSYVSYNGIKLLTTCRIRIYSNADSVGTNNDVIATYQITSTWNDDEMTSYKVVKV